MGITGIEQIDTILAQRELARRYFEEYLVLVNGKAYKRTRFSSHLASELQKFVEADTGNAYDILAIEAPPQHGKALEISTPVLTAQGWKRHGDLRPGDLVFGPDGEWKCVLAVQKPYEHPCMRVTLSTGDVFIAAREHEWIIEGAEKPVETQRLCHRDAIRCTDPLKPILPAFDLPIDPYLLGVWLGDGDSGRPRVCCGYEDVNETLSRLERITRVVYRVHGNSVLLSLGHDPETQTNRIGESLRRLGLIGRKHIPEQYMLASAEDRRDLLCGMMDTDGSVKPGTGTCEYIGTNEELVQDVFTLVRSLGYRCSLRSGDCGYNGKITGTRYRVSFTPRKGDLIFRLRRKQGRVDSKRAEDRAAPARFFVSSVVDAGTRTVNCITVEGGVYLAGRGLVPTHNSMTTTEAFPSWVLGKHPDWRIILASYNDESAEKFCRRNKEKTIAFGETLFGVRIGQINRATEYELDNNRGRLISRGIMSGVTGNPANLLVIDDPIKNRAEADSPTYRSRLWAEWKNSLQTRLSAGAKVILIMTPWHESDFAATLLQTEDNVRLLRLPVEAEANDLLGREPGEALCPELGKDDNWLRQFKASYLNDPEGGQRAWTALYQCAPRVEGGNLVKRDWWRFYDTPPEGMSREIISVDAAFKGSDKNDFVAITVWGKTGNDYYLLYCLNKHLDFSETLQAIRTTKRLYPAAREVVIEDKANGSAIINVLQKEMFCIPVNPKGGKVARVNAISPAIESGHVFVPKNAPWVGEYLDQWTAFPAGTHDDIVDSSSQALSHLLFASGVGAAVRSDQEQRMEEYRATEQEVFLNGDQMFDVYNIGGNG